MPDQVLIIEPQELEFKVDHAGLFQKDVSTKMWLTNPTNDKVLFKIKTTAPKKYCVRPNSGVLESNAKMEIAITPQTLYVEPSEKTKHKFMVQSVVAPSDDANFDQTWKEITPDKLMDHKLKCVFVAEGSPTATSNAGNSTLKQDNIDSTNSILIKNLIQNKPMENLKEDFKTSTPIKSASKTENQNADEMNQLQEERKVLNSENAQLRKEVSQLRNLVANPSSRVSTTSGLNKPNELATIPWVVTALCMAVLGVIIGKFII